MVDEIDRSKSLADFFDGKRSSGSFTWISDSVLIKRMDRSAFIHHGTHIPLDVLSYWGGRHLDIGDSRPVEMHMAGHSFAMKLTREHMGRTRLFWLSDFSAIIRNRFSDVYTALVDGQQPVLFPILRFDKIDDDHYTLELIDEKEITRDATLDEEDQQDSIVNTRDGRVIHYNSKRYERDPGNRRRAIAIHGTTCFGCGFNFGRTYGELGDGFIEIHHILPLSFAGEAIIVDPKNDLVPLCPNCHRMIHRRRDQVLRLDDLRAMIRGAWHD